MKTRTIMLDQCGLFIANRLVPIPNELDIPYTNRLVNMQLHPSKLDKYCPTAVDIFLTILLVASAMAVANWKQ